MEKYTVFCFRKLRDIILRKLYERVTIWLQIKISYKSQCLDLGGGSYRESTSLDIPLLVEGTRISSSRECKSKLPMICRDVFESWGYKCIS